MLLFVFVILVNSTNCYFVASNEEGLAIGLNLFYLNDVCLKVVNVLLSHVRMLFIISSIEDPILRL